MIPPATTLSLFEDIWPEAHALVFEQAFDAWLASQRDVGLLRQERSMEVYQDMWNAFSAWCLAQSPVVSLSSLRPADLEAFQAARFGRKASDLSLTPRYALRLMRLIERVLRHHAAQDESPGSNAAADWIRGKPLVRFADSPHADPLPEYLPVVEAKQLIAFVSAARPRPGSSRAAGAPMTWQDVRNRASIGLQLGAGLTPGDVRVLTLTSPVARGGRILDRPWKIQVPAYGDSPARETPLAPWAAELLRYWLTVRAEAGIAGPYLFPSTRSGKQWQRASQYACATRLLEDAGVDSREGGSFRLRHTFALRQLRRGTSPDQVARWLGIEPKKMTRYERVLLSAPEVV
jgi:integrase